MGAAWAHCWGSAREDSGRLTPLTPPSLTMPMCPSSWPLVESLVVEEAAVVGSGCPAEAVADGEGLLEGHRPGVVRPGPDLGHILPDLQDEEVGHGMILSLGCLMCG